MLRALRVRPGLESSNKHLVLIVFSFLSSLVSYWLSGGDEAIKWKEADPLGLSLPATVFSTATSPRTFSSFVILVWSGESKLVSVSLVISSFVARLPVSYFWLLM